MSAANLFEPEWDDEQEESPFTWRRARLGRQAGCEQLGASLFELPPGGSTFPLHFHHANEEVLVVVAGRPTLRTLDGERELVPGEMVAFPTGRRGAHRLDNRTGGVVRVFFLSTMLGPEMSEYPDSGKVWARTYAPGAERGAEEAFLIAKPEANLDYMEGEREMPLGEP
ncbi:MAG: cupin domain-containing protein [Solirubrobacteraceae bacterium]